MSQTKPMWVDYKINIKSVLQRVPGKARLIVLRENSSQRQYLNKALENVYSIRAVQRGALHMEETALAQRQDSRRELGNFQ